MRLLGHKPRKELNCFSVFHGLISRPTSEIMIWADCSLMPGILVRSTPQTWCNCVRKLCVALGFNADAAQGGQLLWIPFSSQDRFHNTQTAFAGDIADDVA